MNEEIALFLGQSDKLSDQQNRAPAENDFTPRQGSVISNCYGDGCLGGTQPPFTYQPKFYETPLFIGGVLFAVLLLIFIGALSFRNKKKKEK